MSYPGLRALPPAGRLPAIGLCLLTLLWASPGESQGTCLKTDEAERQAEQNGFGLRDEGIDGDHDLIRIYQHSDGRWVVFFLPRSENGLVMCRIPLGGLILERQDVKPGRGT